ncbi:MAG TPA: DNA adenine methylase [Gemmata sp.]|nr:DNA adenine methylase [Gemmata sp.]
MGKVAAIKAPFPYFGGKGRVAPDVWRRFGDVPNYVEPFFGSGAVLLSRPHEPKTETVNDLDGWLTNFWRAVRQDPDRVAAWADYPVSELDLHARGDWLFYREEAADFVERLRADPEFCCFKSAGWWLWGACSWIGTGWGPRQLPHVGNAGMGVNRQLPHVGDAGRGEREEVRDALKEYMRALGSRMRRVRVVCGDWSRVTGPSVTVRHGVTAVFLDPPYGEGEMDYAAGGNATSVARDAQAWALEAGGDPAMRVAFCGYEGSFDFPPSWECFAWKNRGGYGSQGEGDGRANAARERIWFSPYCHKLGHGLFDHLEDTP